MQFEELVAHRTAMKIAKNTAQQQINDMALKAMDTLEAEGPWTVDEVVRVSRIVNESTEYQMGDSLPEAFPHFPAEELRALFKLRNTDEALYRALQGDLIPEVETLAKMSRDKLAVIAENMTPSQLRRFEAIPEFEDKALEILEQAVKREKRRVEKEAAHEAKRVKV
jgi:uncharacterized protein YicC (UPF0701 family)